MPVRTAVRAEAQIISNFQRSPRFHWFQSGTLVSSFRQPQGLAHKDVLQGNAASFAPQGYHPNQEAVMDDSQTQEARTPRIHRYVPELEMLESLNRSLWEVERARVEETTQEKPLK
jgi:hypothetical protein